LILGTFPTADGNQGAYDFFYPNPNNDFWNIIFTISGKRLSDFVAYDQVEIRKQILSGLNLGIADMGYKIFRQKGSSKYGNIFPIQYTDLFSLIDSIPSMAEIIITTSSGANNVLSWFEHYCSLNTIRLNYTSRSGLPKHFNFSLSGNRIEGPVIPSTSRASPYKGEELITFYRKAILRDSS